MPNIINSDSICVIGVGYVGEQLLQTFSRAYNVIGYDVSKSRLEALQKKYGSLANIVLTDNSSHIASASLYLISVPTPLTDDLKNIDTAYLESGLALVEEHAHCGDTVVVESSVAVGMTHHFFGDLKDKSVSVGFSPERVFNSLHSVNTLETAEMTKLFENCFRMINIAYVNEMADACVKLDADPTEVVKAASTKPFGYMPFYHGAGAGGHCIPVNPYYLFANNDMPPLRLATKRTELRPTLLGHKLMQSYPSANEFVLSSVLDHSPSVAIASVLHEADKLISYHDPLVSQSQLPWLKKLSETDWTESYLVKNFDLVVVVMLQKEVDFSILDAIQNVVPVETLCSMSTKKYSRSETSFSIPHAS
ncbi:hypothetical protein BKA69DRAFT_1151762 [Paraphysoderma sedebokerense]|nr:hypothetical protein BKA69DRAFT_1151762 [Paraphysoderma sedebokerense]